MTRRIVIVSGATACFVLAGFFLLAQRAAIAPVDHAVSETFSAGLVARGKTLAAEGHCPSCHTGPDGQPFAGGYRMNTPFGIIYGSNLTFRIPRPGSAYGLCRHLERVMREGVSCDGSHLFPGVPVLRIHKAVGR